MVTDSLVRERKPLLEEWEWQFDGACRDADPNLFFHPENERGFARQRRAEAAKRFCQDCPVCDVCRTHALTSWEPFGVWGGLSEDERNALKEGREHKRW